MPKTNIYKLTYPDGEIYVGKYYSQSGGYATYFGSPSLDGHEDVNTKYEKRLERGELIVKKEILYKYTECENRKTCICCLGRWNCEFHKQENKCIVCTGASNLEKGFNLRPAYNADEAKKEWEECEQLECPEKRRQRIT